MKVKEKSSSFDLEQQKGEAGEVTSGTGTGALLSSRVCHTNCGSRSGKIATVPMQFPSRLGEM